MTFCWRGVAPHSVWVARFWPWSNIFLIAWCPRSHAFCTSCSVPCLIPLYLVSFSLAFLPSHVPSYYYSHAFFSAANLSGLDASPLCIITVFAIIALLPLWLVMHLMIDVQYCTEIYAPVNPVIFNYILLGQQPPGIYSDTVQMLWEVFYRNFK